MFNTRLAMLAVLSAAMIAGCKKESGDEVTIVNPLFRGTLSFTANGGSATGNPADTRGGTGGRLDLYPAGNLFVGVNPAPLPPALPATPSPTQVVASWTDVQTVASGSAIVTGDITAGTTASNATLTVSAGDLVINGGIAFLHDGGEGNSLEINVPAGTVWIHGTIRTGILDGIASGGHGGIVRVTALRIIFTGTIDTRGEDNGSGPGGTGGPVFFDTEGESTGQTSQLLVGGSMNSSGGSSAGPGATAGAGGWFLSYSSNVSNGAVHIIGTNFIANGGSASGTGDVHAGSGGGLDLQGNAGVFFNGSLAGRGGDAFSSDGNASGGGGGGFYENDLAMTDSGPCAVFGSIDVSGGSAVCGPSGSGEAGSAGFIYLDSGTDINLGSGAFSMKGGDAAGRGGPGGHAEMRVSGESAGDLYCDASIDVSWGSGKGEALPGDGSSGSIAMATVLGDIQIAGSLVLNGGGGSGGFVTGGPSSGGTVSVQAGYGNPAHGGSITFRGLIQANGGSDADPADDNNGAKGGTVSFICNNRWGSISLEPGSTIQLNGGAAGGPGSTPVGGSGGTLSLLTPGGSVAGGTVGGNVRIQSVIIALGGSGGGTGGRVYVNTDDAGLSGGGDGRGGDIELLNGALIDVCGGSGAAGGDARNDGLAGEVNGPMAVHLDADGNDSNNAAENGIVRNLGTIIADGGAADGSGGDVLFDGLDPTLVVGPQPGTLELLGTGTGAAGDFKSQ